MATNTGTIAKKALSIDIGRYLWLCMYVPIAATDPVSAETAAQKNTSSESIGISQKILIIIKSEILINESR